MVFLCGQPLKFPDIPFPVYGKTPLKYVSGHHQQVYKMSMPLTFNRRANVKFRLRNTAIFLAAVTKISLFQMANSDSNRSCADSSFVTNQKVHSSLSYSPTACPFMA